MFPSSESKSEYMFLLIESAIETGACPTITHSDYVAPAPGDHTELEADELGDEHVAGAKHAGTAAAQPKRKR